MSVRFKLISVIIAISIMSLLGLILCDVRNTYIELGSIKNELSHVRKQFKQYQFLVQKVNDIDDKFTQELSDAKIKNNQRYSNVVNNLGRLQLNIQQTAATHLDDEKACQLTGEARQNYYLLRDDIITKDSMILGLQRYISDICLAD